LSLLLLHVLPEVLQRLHLFCLLREPLLHVILARSIHLELDRPVLKRRGVLVQAGTQRVANPKRCHCVRADARELRLCCLARCHSQALQFLLQGRSL
jgi:hypothetical protein